jgi:hypothetical protein
MVKRNFTDKEKKVFYGIIKYPGINDNALSKIIDINPSTIATIRNKLKKQNYFQTIRIPFLQNCGFEIFTVSYDRLYSPNLSESPDYILGSIYKRIPNIIFLLSSPDSWLSMGYYQNYLNFKHINEISRINKYHFEMQEDTEKQIIFPFGLTKLYNFFDYSRIIQNFFDLELTTDEQPELYLQGASNKGNENIIQQDGLMTDNNSNFDSEMNLDKNLGQNTLWSTKTTFKLTKAEREVFLALVRYPDLSDFAINKIISISATSINNIRKKFQSNSIIKQRIIPNLSLMGFELITLTHLKFRSFGNIQARKEIIYEIQSKSPCFLYITSNTDEIIMAAYKNFSEYQHVNDDIVRMYRDKGFLSGEPRTLLFPLTESVLVKNHSYVQLVNQFLGRGKSIYDSILEIIGNKLGETGKQMIVKHLENIEIPTEDLTANDVPMLVGIVHDVISPIFGSKSAKEIANKIKKLEKN